jgi:hypothetical protein
MSIDPYATSYSHCLVAHCPHLRLGNSQFCSEHRRRKDRTGLPLRAPLAARRAQGGRISGSYMVATAMKRP